MATFWAPNVAPLPPFVDEAFRRQAVAYSEADERDHSNHELQADLTRHLFAHPQDYYEQLAPPGATWGVFLLFVATDTFVLGVCIASFVSLLSSEPYIVPLTFTLTVALFQALFAVLWVAVYWRGLGAEYERLLKLRITKSGGMFEQAHYPDTRRMDVTSINFTDYQSWTIYALANRLGIFTLVLAALVVYTARYDSSSLPPPLADLATSASAQAWFSTTLFVFAAYFWTYAVEFVAIWKYWTLVWACYDPSVHKNPFFAYKRVLFN